MNDKIFASALASFFLLPGTILFAQQAPDSFSGNPDVLYAKSSRRFSPFAQQEIDNLTLQEQLLNAWNDGNGTLGHYPERSDYSVETAQNGPSIAVGGGFDWVATRPLHGAFSPSNILIPG